MVIIAKSMLKHQKVQIKVISKEIDGILSLHFTSLSSKYSSVVLSCYLSPETSPWGRDVSSFFGHLLSQMYLYSEVDAICVCGDLNSSVGNADDFVREIDDLPMRVVLDEGVNKHSNSI